MEVVISNNRIAIIGCGIFGALAAIRLGEAGYDVNVYEANDLPLSGASLNNLNRVHMGPHYPRDITTAKQSLACFEMFCSEFSDAINKNFTNGYFIAEEGSKTNPENFLEFLESADIPFRQINPSAFPIQITGVSMGIVCNEAVYDVTKLRELLIIRMNKAGIKLNCSSAIQSISIEGKRYALELADGSLRDYDMVINASYHDINRLFQTMECEGPGRIYQYEYTASVILEPTVHTPSVGVTVMDGPFVTLLPFGSTGKYLLYHVEESVLQRVVTDRVPLAWGSAQTSPVNNLLTNEFSDRLILSANKFIPSLSEFKYCGLLHGPRTVLADRDSTDARPSFVREPLPNYFEVFSGKVDHSINTAQKLLELIEGKSFFS